MLFRSIDTRTSVDGLAQLAYQGAKLGMGKYGVDGMTQFVKAADKINVALGEELGEEALPALSKMVEVMGLIPKMGIEKAMGHAFQLSQYCYRIVFVIVFQVGYSKIPSYLRSIV